MLELATAICKLCKQQQQTSSVFACYNCPLFTTTTVESGHNSAVTVWGVIDKLLDFAQKLGVRILALYLASLHQVAGAARPVR